MWVSMTDALANLHVMQGALVVAGGHLDADGLIGGIGEQALFAGMDGIEQALAGKLAALKDGEAARVERQLGLVFKPDGAQRRGLSSRSTG